MKERGRDVLKQMFMFVTLLGSVNFYVLAIFTLFCIFTGRITREKAVLVLEVLRGHVTSEKPPTRYDLTPVERDAMREQVRRQLEVELTTRQREAESILSRAGQVRGDLELERKLAEEAAKQLAADRAAYEAHRKAEEAKRASAEFAQNVKWFSTIDPAEGAKILAEMPEEDVMRYLRALKERTAAELIVALAAEDERRDLRNGSTLAVAFRKAVADLPAAMAAGVSAAPPAAGATAPPR